MHTIKTRAVVLTILLIGLWTSTGQAADHAEILPFVTDDVVAIGHLDLTAVDLPATVDKLFNWDSLPAGQRDDAHKGAAVAQRWCDQLVRHGVLRVYVLLRTSDIQDTGPTWVLMLSENADAKTTIEFLSQLFRGDLRSPIVPSVFRSIDGAVLAAANDSQMERLAVRRAEQPRAELVEAFQTLGDADAGFVVLGDTNSRRVVRELFPRLPEPFAKIDGPLIADGLRWGSVTITLQPEPRISIRVETSNRRVAQTLEASAVKTLELAHQLSLTKLPTELPDKAADAIEYAYALLKPKVEGTAVTLTIGDDAGELDRLRSLVSVPIASATTAAQRNHRINLFRQLTLAFLNYESANGTLAQQANYDETGRPLLSWRVHLLPFLEQKDLYDQFHLDEPWDSPHNRQLIARMPDVYADPSRAVRRLVGEGRTTFVAPTADQTLFPVRDALPEGMPLQLRDVRDGTSKTILFVEVIPERAVVWTKPEDWMVDFDHPLHGVKRTDRPTFTVAFCDGHVQQISNDLDADTFGAMLTRDGREPVD